MLLLKTRTWKRYESLEKYFTNRQNLKVSEEEDRYLKTVGASDHDSATQTIRNDNAHSRFSVHTCTHIHIFIFKKVHCNNYIIEQVQRQKKKAPLPRICKKKSNIMYVPEKMLQECNYGT